MSRRKALDFAALKQGSVSSFDVEKLETIVSRWVRAKNTAAKVLVHHKNSKLLHNVILYLLDLLENYFDID
ncbi:hypothetical protein I3843_05G160900 [Carya illinoinensis]|nr:hypothetical protein I3843_05G160900 [Carya illinoinensis]